MAAPWRGIVLLAQDSLDLIPEIDGRELCCMCDVDNSMRGRRCDTHYYDTSRGDGWDIGDEERNRGNTSDGYENRQG